MKGSGRFVADWQWIEWVFAAAVVFLLIRAGFWVYLYGHLPQPFFYEPSDTFMDWFNTAYWAHDPGAFDSWRTVYPPLSFVVMRLLSLPGCYTGAEGLTSRDCDWLGFVGMFGFFVLNCVITYLSYRRLDRRTAIPRAIALALGMPMMYALERGNILLICFTCFVLGFGPLLRSARLRWLFAGLAVNFKVYLVATIAAQVVRGRWRWIEGALIASVFIYLVTFALQGGGTPFEIFRNITDFSEGFIAAQVLDLWYSVTYQPLLSLLEGKSFPTTLLIGSKTVEIAQVVVPALVHFGQGIVVLAAAATWLKPKVVPVHRVAFLGTILALISSEAGGYTEILAIFFILMEPWRGIGRRVAIVLAYLLCLPGDIEVGYVPPLYRDSFLVGHAVEVHFGVGLGMFLRPGMVIGTGIALSLVTLRDVWAGLRADGWRASWQGRVTAIKAAGR
jgi:hypothetical protein